MLLLGQEKEKDFTWAVRSFAWELIDAFVEL